MNLGLAHASAAERRTGPGAPNPTEPRPFTSLPKPAATPWTVSPARSPGPMLIANPEGEQFWPGQSQRLKRRCPGRRRSCRSQRPKAPTATASHSPARCSNNGPATGSTRASPRCQSGVDTGSDVDCGLVGTEPEVDVNGAPKCHAAPAGAAFASPDGRSRTMRTTLNTSDSRRVRLEPACPPRAAPGHCWASMMRFKGRAGSIIARA
jgi:hypothetical protein